MRRPAHGATTRPGPCRPTSGYGRVLGRPGPRTDGVVLDDAPVRVLDPSQFGVRGAEPETEAPAPVTP